MDRDRRGEGYGTTHVHVSGQKLKVILLMVGPVQLGVHRVVVAAVEVSDGGGSGLSGHMHAHGHGECIPQPVYNGVKAYRVPPQHGRVADRQKRRLLVLLPLVLLFPVSPSIVGDHLRGSNENHRPMRVKNWEKPRRLINIVQETHYTCYIYYLFIY